MVLLVALVAGLVVGLLVVYRIKSCLSSSSDSGDDDPQPSPIHYYQDGPYQCFPELYQAIVQSRLQGFC